MSSDTSSLGPVEMLLVAFPRDRFDGSMLPALQEVVDAGIVRIVDLVVVRKDEDGSVSAAEIAELDPDEAELFDQLDGEIGELFNDEDLVLAAEQLEPGTSAALVLWENTWAARLAEAVAGNGGEILAHDRIPGPVVAEALAAQPSA